MKSTHTTCTECGHSAVCGFKDEFLTARRALDDLSYECGESAVRRLSDDTRFSVELRCKHYIPNISYRGKRNIDSETQVDDSYMVGAGWEKLR